MSLTSESYPVDFCNVSVFFHNSKSLAVFHFHVAFYVVYKLFCLRLFTIYVHFAKFSKANHYLTGRSTTHCRKLIPTYNVPCKSAQAHEHERNVLEHEFPSYEDHTLENVMNYGNIHRKAFDEYSRSMVANIIYNGNKYTDKFLRKYDLI